MVAPSARRRSSITSASLLPSRGAATRAGRPPSSGLAPFCGWGASPCSVASCDPSSTAMALFAVREDVSLDVLLAHGRRGLRITHDERKRPFSPSGVSDADYRAFRYASAVHDYVFELKRGDPFASGLDDVFDAIGNLQ